MKYAKALSMSGVAVMAAAIAYALAKGDFRKEGAQIVSMPWGILSLADVYVGFSLFSGWVIYRERSLARSLPWVASFMTLGNVVTSLYAALALFESRGDWKRFWLGERMGD